GPAAAVTALPHAVSVVLAFAQLSTALFNASSSGMNSTQNTIAAAAMISSSPAALSMVAVIALRMTSAMMVPAATPAPPNSAWPACGEPCDCNGGSAGGF